MSIVNLGNHSIGGGASIANLSFNITTQSLTPKIEKEERLVIGKPVPDPGQLGITIKANFTPRGTTPSHMFGIKQIISIRGITVQYSGLKDIDGSIVEGSTTFNFTTILDTRVFADAATFALLAPQAPFYELGHPAFFRAGTQAELNTADSPGGAYPLRKRNHVTDRFNFLDAVDESANFATVLVV